MRPTVDSQKIERLMQVLGREARGSGCVYFTGGASALLIGWRSSTVDIDIRLDPEPPGIFQAIAKIKQELNINIELASPQDFLPPLPGWRGQLCCAKGNAAFSSVNRGKSRFITMTLLLKRFQNSLEALIVTLRMFKPCMNRNYFP